MKIVVTEMPKTSQECLFSQVLSNGILTCILDNGNYCKFICEETTQCPCLITYDKLNDNNNTPINKEYILKKDEEGNDICLIQLPKICDKNINELELGDKVLLFGKEGEIRRDCGAYGIYFKEGIDWSLIESKIPEVTGLNNTPHFCYNDTFVSFWELMWNFNCCIEDVCEVVEKI